MILFVFEGQDDNAVMNTLAALYPKAISEDVVCIFENNIHQLYSRMKSSDSDPDFTESILSVLKKMPKYSNDSRIVDADEDTYSQTFQDFLLYNVHELYGSKKDRRRACVADNWRYVIFQNVAKANYICSGVNEIPQSKECVGQDLIFHNQLTKYVDHGCVAVLSAYPMFLFEYLKYTL